MALESRAHEILMAEMAVVVKRYRRERGRLYEANRKLLQRLAELEAQVLYVYTFLSGRAVLRIVHNSRFLSGFCRSSADKARLINSCACVDLCVLTDSRYTGAVGINTHMET